MYCDLFEFIIAFHVFVFQEKEWTLHKRTSLQRTIIDRSLSLIRKNNENIKCV